MKTKPRQMTENDIGYAAPKPPAFTFNSYHILLEDWRRAYIARDRKLHCKFEPGTVTFERDNAMNQIAGTAFNKLFARPYVTQIEQEMGQWAQPSALAGAHQRALARTMLERNPPFG